MNETDKLLIEEWQKMPFTNFKADKEKKEKWFNYALEVYNSIISGRSTGLISETGTGKTIMAIMAIEALKVRTIFFAPTVILVRQHAKLYKQMTGKKTAMITGQTKNRDWQKRDVIFATPHVFMAEHRNEKVSESDFKFFIADEMHKASGRYPYVAISKLAQSSGIPILGLSASPAGSLQEISNVEKTYNIKKWVTAEIEMPEKKMRLIKVETSQEMNEASKYLKKFYLNTMKALSDYFNKLSKPKILSLNSEDPFLTQEENEQLKTLVDRIQKPQRYTAIKLFAKLMKIAWMYRLLMTEGYAAFLEYYEESLANDKTKAGKEIYADRELKKIYWQIKRLSKDHPKEIALFDLVKEMDYKRKSMLVFVNSKKTGAHLADFCTRLGYPASTLFGGAGKSSKKNQKTIEDLVDEKIKIIFATSVVEEGLSLPEIGVVIHYNLPMTEVARLQRGGRTGRFNEGFVIFIIMDIPYENALYFATLAKLKKMKMTFYESEREKVRKIRGHKKKKKMELSGQFEIKFDEFQPKMPF